MWKYYSGSWFLGVKKEPDPVTQICIRNSDGNIIINLGQIIFKIITGKVAPARTNMRQANIAP
jgi:hypothetical protein